MDLKVEIGNKIRQFRLTHHLTQADLCGDETELTIRQLARIENGQSMISLQKLSYLSKKFNIAIHDLIEPNAISLPKRYLEIKNKLIKSHTYGDHERIKATESLFDELYEQFYDNLPEEEQLFVEIHQVYLDVFSTHNTSYAIVLFEEYFIQILKKREYSYNDLLLINLYFLCCAMGLEDKSYFDDLSQKLVTCVDFSNLEKSYLMERILISILCQVPYEQIPTYTKILRQIIQETNNFQHKPAVYAFEARYYVRFLKDKEQGEQCYNKAIAFARMLNDEVLVTNLKLERDTDLAT